MFTRVSIRVGLVVLGLIPIGLTATAATTTGTVTFQDDTSATAPVDPTSPNIPLTPADPNNPATNNTETLRPKVLTLGRSRLPMLPKLTMQLEPIISTCKFQINAPLPTVGKSMLNRIAR